MRRPARVLLALALLPSCTLGRDSPRTVIRDVVKAMGAESVRSIQLTGSATAFGFGGSANADDPWPALTTYTYSRAIDLSKSVIHSSVWLATDPGSREMHQIINGDSRPRDQLEMSMTPWGFLRGALANGATVERRTLSGTRYRVLSWTTPHRSPAGRPYRLAGYVDAKNVLTRVETYVDDPLFGDLLVEREFSDYREANGVLLPASIVEKQGGWPVLRITITDAQTNPANIETLLEPPPADNPPRRTTSTRAAPPPATRAIRLSDGVYKITGGYVAVAVEFADHVAVIEGGESEARALAIIAETARVVPGKPIRYVVNTHHHFDHASGLPAFAAKGATILTHRSNVSLFERVLNGPRTLGNDPLGKSGMRATFQAVDEIKVLKDATRTVELHHIRDLAHASGMLIAYLPKERIVVQADMAFIGPYQPGAGEHRTATLVENLSRLKLDYDTVVFVHAPEPDRRVTRHDLLALALRDK